MTAPDGIGDQLEAIAGVASAEVTFRDDATPIARVWLDGSESADEVRAKVNALLGAAVPEAAPGKVPPKRGGLGKGLADVLSEDDVALMPSHLTETGSSHAPSGLRRVAVVETATGVSVEVEDARGARVARDVVDGSIDAAVVEAVLTLRNYDVEMPIDLVDTDLPGGPAILAAIDFESSRSLGAAFVEFGRPWAVASAVAKALREL